MTLRLLPKVLISDIVFNKLCKCSDQLKSFKGNCKCWRKRENKKEEEDIGVNANRSIVSVEGGSHRVVQGGTKGETTGGADLNGEGYRPGDANLPQKPQQFLDPPELDDHGKIVLNKQGRSAYVLSGTGGVKDARGLVQEKIDEAIKGLWLTYQTKARQLMEEIERHPGVVRVDGTGMLIFKHQRSNLHIATALFSMFQKTSATIPKEISLWIHALIHLNLDSYIVNEQLANFFNWWEI
jgi:hypothetical protein